ncbi:membrane-bound dehydrogenase domain protein : Membrane-bound dehydrogenase domain-containing protein OS=Rhodopirellula maiorica SM1 GN=RMSM_03692 PE=4 SV=1: Cytochrom_C [Gemmataceae bacterium]|nr:membrane-bound dehydrogenase domain protein : Membrane-bound dehydrogenase domain-containing protein OS=Rhodopirellula maiorica SM1 GN=RMSM_03692 PE=4 SV=1: Cytochrom_C [Gemmataceae bacterium]VTU02845.1 membrane-bound dehydrogenase domain protein : Membrane-bound dehydrogenase domain-containing protein OS=Rhodopirellula maiorica SM1 GN=RMSM_03692 PE=4 SV=1: Cytochrom_C [Gemmataceae bacterium]
MRLPLALAGTLLLASTALAQKEFGFDNRKPSGQPYLTPAESLTKIKVPDEFEVKLFAAEPQVVNPVAFTIDEKGRLWVVECYEYPKRTPKGKAPRDRIVILEDTDGDGACDKQTVFAEGKDFPVPEERKNAGLGAFDLCTGIEVGHGGVFVGAAPYLWFIENKGDKAGKFEVLLKGFGSQDTHETLNTFQWGPDGWLYGLHGVFTQSNVKALDGPETRMNAAVWRYHPTQKKFEIFAEGTSNPWGMDWRNTDGQFIVACCVIPHLFHVVPGGVYRRQAGTSYNPHVYGYINEICDHTFHKESGWAHAGLISLDTPIVPEKYRNSVIFGSIHGCSLKQNVLKPNGSTYTASRAADFLQSGDKNFRPINLRWGPAGDIYVIDWHDQNPCHQTNPDDWDYARGRVYRVQLKGTKAKKPDDLAALDLKALVKAVGADDPYRWRTALRLLGEKKLDGEARTAATLAARETPPPLSRAAWFANAISPITGELAAKYQVPDERAKSMGAEFVPFARVMGECPDLQPKTIDTFTRIAALTASPALRREFASVAVRHADRLDVTQLLRALMSHKEDAKDPVISQLVWLAYEKSLASGGRKPAAPAPAPPAPKNEQPADAVRSPVETELTWLAEQAPANEFVRDQIVPKVMRRLVALDTPESIKQCVGFVAKLKDAASREKALEGLSVATQGRTINAPEGWAELKAEIDKDNNPKVVALANKLSVSFRDPAAIKRALDAAANAQLPADARAEAVRQLAALKPAEGIKLLLGLLNDESAGLGNEAARALAAFDQKEIPGVLVAKWATFPKGVRPDLVNTLASHKHSAKELLEAMLAKKIDRGEVTDNVILRVQAFKDKELEALIAKAWGRTRPTPDELNKIIDKTRESLFEAPASFARGKAVFDNVCGKCHKFEGRGAEVGPPLEGAARDIEYILVNVIDPNRVIGAPYFVRTARLLDDTVFQGLLAEEDEKTVTLKLEGAAFKTIKKDDLAEPMRVSEKSLMPEGLGYNMTPQNFRDMVRYVMASPFLTDVTVNGEKLSVGVPGRLVLPDTKGAPAIVEAELTAAADLKTKLLVGSTTDYEVRLDGKVLGTGKGAGKQMRPDQDGYDVALTPGKHTVTIAVKSGGAGAALHARFLDPDRKLQYPDVADEKK